MNLNFEFTPKIDKDFLLSKNSEETYMTYYLGIPVKKGLVVNPLRNDHNPTASFYRSKNTGELIFNDFGSSFHGNFISVVMEKYGCTYYQACEQIAKDFNLCNVDNNSLAPVIVKNTTKFNTSEPSTIQITEQKFTDLELKWWGSYGITSKILRKFNVYSCKHVFLNGNLQASSSDRCPIFGYYLGQQDSRELWRIYFPKRTSYRFLSNTSAKKIQGFKQLPKTGNALVITKSLKDVMCLYSMGVSAIAPNSEKLFISDSVLEELKTRFKYIIVFYDNDIPGIEGMKKIKKEHPELIYTWLPRKYAKDISDFYKIYGKESTLTILKQFIKWLKETRQP